MPIPLNNPKTVALNALAARNVILNTYVRDDGVLTASAHITLAVGSTDEAGKWAKDLVPVGGPGGSLHIADITALPPDVVSIAPDIEQVFVGIVTALGKINAIRKIV